MTRSKGEFPDTRSWRVLADTPASPPILECLFEQEKVAQALRGAILMALRERKSNAGGARILALYGKYGQGKSIIINKLSNFFRTSDEFSVSNYNYKDLINDFDIFTMSGTRRFIHSAILVLIALIGLPAVVNSIKYIGYYFNIKEYANITLSSDLIVIIITFIIGYGGWRYLLRDFLRDHSFKGLLKTIKVWFVKIFLRKPVSLIIIDDLDRASPEQQRAFLLALNKHKHDTDKIFLVAFDEEPLLASAADAPRPAELLDKTFDASFRLAPLNIQDAALMACAFLEQTWRNNRECLWARRLNDPQIVGDVARVLFLHGSASARFARRLVNNLYTDVLRLKPRDFNDISALVRLAGIYQHVPVLESNLDFLISALNGHDDDYLVQGVKDRFKDVLDPLREKDLRGFLKATRHMKPEDSSWGYVMRIWWRDLQDTIGDTLEEEWRFTSNRSFSRKFRIAWAIADIHLLDTSGASQRLHEYDQLKRRPGEIINSESLSADPLEELNRAFDDASHLLGPAGAEDEIDMWRALLTRLHAHDGASLRQMGPDGFAELAERYQGLPEKMNRPLPPILFFHEDKKGGRCNWATPSQAVLHLRALGAAALAKSGGPALLTKNIALLLRYADHEGAGFPFPSRSGAGAILPPPMIISSLKEGWPHFECGDHPQRLSQQEIRHFKALGSILPQLGASLSCLPHAHRRWIVQRAANGHHEALLTAILHLLPCSPDDGSRIRCAATIREIGSVMSTDYPDTHEALKSRIARYSARPVLAPTQIMAWFAGVI